MSAKHRKKRHPSRRKVFAVDATSLIQVGRIGKPHGLVGELKVIPETDDPRRIATLAHVFVGDEPATSAMHEVASARMQQTKHGITVVLGLAGVDSREAASLFRGKVVWGQQSDLPPLEEDEFFLHDLIGLEVVASDDSVLGFVKDVLDLPAQRVFLVERPDKSEAMIPAVPPILLDIDLDNSRIVVDPIEGLLE